eukprot:7610063-Pyramimonas_sp.AAC.1
MTLTRPGTPARIGAGGDGKHNRVSTSPAFVYRDETCSFFPVRASHLALHHAKAACALSRPPSPPPSPDSKRPTGVPQVDTKFAPYRHQMCPPRTHRIVNAPQEDTQIAPYRHQRCPLRTPNRRCAPSRHPQSPPADTKRAPRKGHRIPPHPSTSRGVPACPAW